MGVSKTKSLHNGVQQLKQPSGTGSLAPFEPFDVLSSILLPHHRTYTSTCSCSNNQRSWEQQLCPFLTTDLSRLRVCQSLSLPACSFKSWMRVVRFEADKKNKPSIIDVCPLRLWGIAGCFKFMEMQMNRLFVHCVLATRSEEVHLHNENFDRKHTVYADCRIFEHFFRSQKAPIVSLGAMTLI